MSLLVLFSSVRKARIFLLGKGEKRKPHRSFRCGFLFQKPVSVFSLYRFYVVAQDNSYFQSRAYSTKYDIESGITKKRRSSLSKSVDGFFSLSLRCMLYFAPAGADFPAAITSRTANDGERTQVRGSVCWEPWVCAPQQKHESPRLESR